MIDRWLVLELALALNLVLVLGSVWLVCIAVARWFQQKTVNAISAAFDSTFVFPHARIYWSRWSFDVVLRLFDCSRCSLDLCSQLMHLIDSIEKQRKIKDQSIISMKLSSVHSLPRIDQNIHTQATVRLEIIETRCMLQWNRVRNTEVMCEMKTSVMCSIPMNINGKFSYNRPYEYNANLTKQNVN